MRLTPYIKNLLLSVPLAFLTLVPFLLLVDVLEISIEAHLVALGVLGWWIALILRLPVIWIAKNINSEKSRNIVVYASGPAEEVVRLLLLLFVGLTLENGYLIGLGWAAIEIVYSIVQGVGMGVLEQKTDKKAFEAKAMMKSMGMDKAMEPSAPFWGVIERVSANAMHISFSLLLVVSPYLILLTTPLHSFMNVLITKLIKRSIVEAEIAVFALSATIFATALLLT